MHLLLAESVGSLNAKQTELLIDARENTERLVRIVDELLALARLENRHEPLALTAADPEELLCSAVDRVGPRLSGRRIEYQIEREYLGRVSVDTERFGHALDNLLVNAATYTEPGGVIQLRARSNAEGQVELAIADNGVGIPPEHVAHVFDKFFRIPGQTRGDGSGLGLAIVRDIATAHGGTVTCESEPGKGTTFRIVLPASGGKEQSP